MRSVFSNGKNKTGASLSIPTAGPQDLIGMSRISQAVEDEYGPGEQWRVTCQGSGQPCYPCHLQVLRRRRAKP